MKIKMEKDLIIVIMGLLAIYQIAYATTHHDAFWMSSACLSMLIINMRMQRNKK